MYNDMTQQEIIEFEKLDKALKDAGVFWVIERLHEMGYVLVRKYPDGR